MCLCRGPRKSDIPCCKCQHEVFFGGCFYLKIACYLKKQKNAYWVGILSEGAIIILCTNVLTRYSWNIDLLQKLRFSCFSWRLRSLDDPYHFVHAHFCTFRLARRFSMFRCCAAFSYVWCVAKNLWNSLVFIVFSHTLSALRRGAVSLRDALVKHEFWQFWCSFSDFQFTVESQIENVYFIVFSFWSRLK